MARNLTSYSPAPPADNVGSRMLDAKTVRKKILPRTPFSTLYFGERVFMIWKNEKLVPCRVERTSFTVCVFSTNNKDGGAMRKVHLMEKLSEALRCPHARAAHVKTRRCTARQTPSPWRPRTPTKRCKLFANCEELTSGGCKPLLQFVKSKYIPIL